MGLDVHKKAIAYCAKNGAGKVIEQGEIRANRLELGQLAERLKKTWSAALEATLFTGWTPKGSPTGCAATCCPPATWPAARAASSAGCCATATWC